jgi:hypothetical protein
MIAIPSTGFAQIPSASSPMMAIFTTRNVKIHYVSAPTMVSAISPPLAVLLMTKKYAWKPSIYDAIALIRMELYG